MTMLDTFGRYILIDVVPPPPPLFSVRGGQAWEIVGWSEVYP